MKYPLGSSLSYTGWKWPEPDYKVMAEIGRDFWPILRWDYRYTQLNPSFTPGAVRLIMALSFEVNT